MFSNKNDHLEERRAAPEITLKYLIIGLEQEKLHKKQKLAGKGETKISDSLNLQDKNNKNLAPGLNLRYKLLDGK